MVGHYSLKGFLRAVPNVLLIEYFTNRKINLNIDLLKLAEKQVDTVCDALNSLPEEQHNGLDADFRNVTMLGNEAGIQTLLSEGEYSGIKLQPDFKTHSGFMAKSFWTYLKHPEIFESALLLAAKDRLSGRYWKRHLPIPAKPLQVTSGEISKFEKAISEYFLNEEGRGRACKIDHYPRGKLHYFYAFPEDYSASMLAWQNNRLGTHSFRPAFEVIFIYNEGCGFVDIYFEGGKKTINSLRQLFADIMLGIEDLPDDKKPSYALDSLRNRNFSFHYGTDSEIIDVAVKKLRFDVKGGSRAKITIEAESAKSPKSLYNVIDFYLNSFTADGSKTAFHNSTVIGAGIQVTFANLDGKKNKKRSFDLSTKSCSLKYEGDDLAIRNMLIASGIDLTSQANPDDQSQHG